MVFFFFFLRRETRKRKTNYFRLPLQRKYAPRQEMPTTAYHMASTSAGGGPVFHYRGWWGGDANASPSSARSVGRQRRQQGVLARAHIMSNHVMSCHMFATQGKGVACSWVYLGGEAVRLFSPVARKGREFGSDTKYQSVRLWQLVPTSATAAGSEVMNMALVIQRTA